MVKYKGRFVTLFSPGAFHKGVHACQKYDRVILLL